MNWQTHLAACNVWYWFLFPELPNGWSAGVCDDSQASAPAQPTRYHAFASAKMQYVCAPKYCATLEEAKREAIILAISQPQAAQTTEELQASIGKPA